MFDISHILPFDAFVVLCTIALASLAAYFERKDTHD